MTPQRFVESLKEVFDDYDSDQQPGVEWLRNLIARTDALRSEYVIVKVQGMDGRIRPDRVLRVEPKEAPGAQRGSELSFLAVYVVMDVDGRKVFGAFPHRGQSDRFDGFDWAPGAPNSTPVVFYFQRGEVPR